MKNRWESYIMFKNEESINFWKEHFSRKRKTLFILGLGFDIRMNCILSQVINSNAELDLDCMLISFKESSQSPSLKLSDNVKSNLETFNKIIGTRTVINKNCNIWNNNSKKKIRIGDREIAKAITIDDINNYSDIILDISSLPRGIYFSLIGKLLTLIDFEKLKINLFVCVVENAKIDAATVERMGEGDLNYTHGFSGNIELTSEAKPLVWFPILGENKEEQIRRVYSKISDLKNRDIEICPTLPFPSKDPRRSDNIITQYHEILFDELNVESQNIMYVPEANPFEAYIRFNKTIKNFMESLSLLDGCKFILSIFSSKLISLGALLSAYENSDDVGILNVDSQGYEINNENVIEEASKSSEVFVTWLTGEPFEN